MKLKITKEEYKDLSEVLQNEYKAEGDGYILNVDGLEDTGALKRAKDHEKEARKQAEAKAREVEEALNALKSEMDKLKDDGSRKAGDIEALEKSWQKKVADLEAKSKAEADKLLAALKRNTVEATARSLATDLSGDNADIILPHILGRLGFEMADGNPTVRVLGPDGNPTADSLEDLKNFYFTNQKFAPIVIGSKATGGGAAGDKGRGGAAPKKLSEMTGLEEVEFAKANPEKYKQMLAAQGQP